LGSESEVEQIFNHATWLFFFGAGLWMVFARRGAGLRVLRHTNAGFLLLLLLAAGSVVWSIDPAATLARLFHLVTILLACLGVTIHGWKEGRYQEVVRPVITAFLLGSLIFGLVAPDLAILVPTYPDTGIAYWGGLTIGKNALGSIASAGIILWVHGWASRQVRPLTAVFGVALAVLLLALSRAATHMVSTAVVCGLMLVMLRSPPNLRRYAPYLIGLLTVMIILYGLVILDVVPGLDILLEPITALTGKDRTFTNRALIWQITREHVSLSPVLGSGYGAFWAHVGPGTPANAFVVRMFFNPGECHDGYLEIINDLGFLGLLVLLAYLFTYLMTALKLLKPMHAQATLYLGLLFQQLISGLTESNWLWICPDFMMFTLAALCMAQNMRDLELRRASNAVVPAAVPRGVRLRTRFSGP